VLPSELTEPASAIASRLSERGESIAVAESAAGGLISAALVAVPGASSYYRGGLVVYTLAGATALLPGAAPLPPDVRGASEPFARWLATAAAASLAADWGIGETGAAGPTGNPYGDPAGHSWASVYGPGGKTRVRNVLTGSADREGNMQSFAAAALALVLDALT
jgi:nicotinamide-nucleotide amidase